MLIENLIIRHSSILVLSTLICLGFSGFAANASSSNEPVMASDTLRRIGGKVNSPYRENGPLVTPDGATMYFSRSSHPENYGGIQDKEDIWYAQWDSTLQSWEEALHFPYFNNAFPNFVISITIDDGIPTLVLGNDYSNPKKQ